MQSEELLPSAGALDPARRGVAEYDPLVQGMKERGLAIWQLNKSVLFDRELETYERAGSALAELRGHQQAHAQDPGGDVLPASPYDVLVQMEGASEVFERGTETAAAVLQERFAIFGRDISDFAAEPVNGAFSRYVRMEALQLFHAGDTEQYLQQTHGVDLAALERSGDISALTQLLADRAIPAARLALIARGHIERIQEQRTEMATLFEQYKAEFADLVQRAVYNGELPETARENLQRLPRSVARVTDTMLELRSVGTAALYHPFDGVEIFSYTMQPGQRARLRHTVFHELVHVIAGKEYADEPAAGEDSPRALYVRRNGLAFIDDNNTWMGSWATEAVTEQVARQLSGYGMGSEDSAEEAYFNERQQLDALIAGGLEPAVVMAAYFENVSMEQPEQERGHRFSTLHERVNDLMGVGGWEHLENVDTLSRLSYMLYFSGLYPIQSDRPGTMQGGVDARDFAPDADVYHISIVVGPTATGDFLYVALKTDRSGRRLTAQDHFDYLDRVLHAVEMEHRGKFAYTVTTPNKPTDSERPSQT